MDSDLGLDPTLVWEIVEQKPPISLNVNPYVKKLCTHGFAIVLEWDTGMHFQALYIGLDKKIGSVRLGKRIRIIS
jgi:hypothetical protein